MSKFKNANFDAYAAAIRQRESSGNYTVVNSGGFTGAYQFGKSALIDAGFMDQSGNWTSYAQSLGVNSMEDFKNSPEAQDTAFQNLTEKNWDYLRNYLPYVGQTIGGVPVTVSGILAGAHLVGNKKVMEFLDSNGASVPEDQNHTPITEYMKKFGGYDFIFDNNRKGFGGALEPNPSPQSASITSSAPSQQFQPFPPSSAPPGGIPYLPQTQALDPAFGATNWPARPASPNTLPPDAARPFAGAPRVAPAPFVDGTIRAQQALDNSLPASGAAPWALSDRFGVWGNIGGVSGPTRSGGSDGPGQTGDGNNLGAGGERFAQVGVDPSRPSQPTPPLAAPKNSAPPSARRLSSPILDMLPADPNQSPRVAGPGLGVTGGALSFPPVWSPPEALLAPNRNRAMDDWVQPLPFRSAVPPIQNAPGGLPGLIAQMGAFDPSNPDQPPAGGLVRLLREWMRNNPDGGSAP